MAGHKQKYVEFPVSSLLPYENNARTHSEEQVDKICESIKEFGFINPVLVNKDNVVIAGHGRLMAAKKLLMEKVPCLFIEHLTEAQMRAYVIADNRLAEDAGWDMEILQSELEALQDMDFNIELTGFSMDDFEVEEIEEVEEDEFDGEPPEEPTAKRGDIYQLGKHRLMCGDSTMLDDVQKLVGGASIDLLITDPPYNVDYTGKTKDALKIQNDKMQNDDFHQFLYDVFTNAYTVMKDGAAFYCWYASVEVANFFTSIQEAGLSVKQELVWNKNTLIMGRQDYQWKHEPCLYGWKETAAHNWYSDRKQTTVIDWDKPARNELHPTMKPVGLFDYQIKNSTKKGDNVLDLFGGSGTTLMACEENGRTAYLMEFDPRYVDVIVRRWEEHTGRKAVLLND